MVQSRIALVAPFPALTRIAHEVVAERANEWPEEVSVYTGDLEDGVAAACQAIAEGAEVIISRGGTASLIARRVDIPVVEVQVTVLDVLRALERSGHTAGTVGVAGFSNVIYGCEDLGRLWGIDIREISLDTLNSGEAEMKIAAAACDGIRLIVGDSIAVKLAYRLGMEGERSL